MKRFLFGVGVIITAIVVGLVPQLAGAKNTDNFVINQFDVEYYLSKDADNRSVLKTTERITATFPNYDQNHGLERAIPEVYDGHSVHLVIDSVTDETGEALPFDDSNSSNDNRVLRIGDADTYVHGQKTYVITYTSHDVTKFFTDTNDDEFYWNVTGTLWAQPIEKASARIIIDPSIASSLNQQMSCYQGIQESKETCKISQTKMGESQVIAAEATRPLQPEENVSFAVGFVANTFAAYQQSAAEKMIAVLMTIWVVALIVGSIAAIIAIIWMSIVRHGIMHRAKGRQTIIAEYLPPKDASVLAAAQVLGITTSAMTAQIIDLAVRHYLKIYQTKDKTVFKSAEYELEIAKDASDLSTEERRMLSDLFGTKNPAVGTRFKMKDLQSGMAIGQKLTKSRKVLTEAARGVYRLFEKAPRESKNFNRIGVIMIIVGIITLSPLVVVAAIVAFVFAYTLWPLTDKGAELRDYALGLKLYISVAEEERLKMLQSPDGAEKVGRVSDGDPKQLVKLYERVLPYAVLFGQEKEWTKQLGAYYESTAQQPDWYAGNGVFNAAIFSSALNSFSMQSNSYTSPSSSSSGGSGGGGFSGGGGGGGGGGGW